MFVETGGSGAYLACRTCPAGKGSLAVPQRQRPETAGRVETPGSSEEACDPGPDRKPDSEGETEGK